MDREKRRRACFLRSEEHTSELQSPCNLVCRLLLEKKKLQRACRRSLLRFWRDLVRRGTDLPWRATRPPLSSRQALLPLLRPRRASPSSRTSRSPLLIALFVRA